VRYEIFNVTDNEMYFSVGGHPAFKLPLVNGTSYDDYYLEFNKKEDAGRWPISKEGLIELDPQSLLTNTSHLPLSKQLFQQDALVFKQLQSDIVSLRSDKSPHGLDFHFNGFPFLGIWAAKNADFICIEPWCGIADSVDSDQQLKNKEGIIHLAPREKFSRSWSVGVE
jgi:galactose mutarotase-like enzyme